MKVKKLKNEMGVVDGGLIISEDGSYVRNKITGEKFIPYIGPQGYKLITLKVGGINYNPVKICILQWWAWNGLIFSGHVIHHKLWSRNAEKNKQLKSNDHIDNLDCILLEKHLSIHHKGRIKSIMERNKLSESHKKENLSMDTLKKLSESQVGEKNSMAKLTNGQVDEMRLLFYAKDFSIKEIVNKFLVSQNYTYQILRGDVRNSENLSKKDLRKHYKKFI